MARNLVKRCDCDRARWAKCAHGWYVRKMIDAALVQVSLDELLGHTKIRLVSHAEEVRDTILGALRGRPADINSAPWLATHPALQPWRTTAVSLGPTAGHITFDALRDRYVETLDEAGKPDQYVANVTGKLARAAAWPLPASLNPRGDRRLGSLPAMQVTDDLLEKFLGGLVKLDYSVSTRNKYLDLLRRFGRWAKRKGYRETAWLVVGETDVKRQKEARRSRRLQVATASVPSEEDRVLAVAPPLLWALIIAGLETGARLGELLRMTWGQMHFDRSEVGPFQDLKEPTLWHVVPMTARLRAVLEMRQQAPDGRPHPPDAYVFGNEVGERQKRISKAWETAVLKAHGGPVAWTKKGALMPESRAFYHQVDLLFHDFRHEAISRWLDARVPLTSIQAWVGHASLEMTLKLYGNAHPAESQAAMVAYQAARPVALPTAPGRRRPAKLVQTGYKNAKHGSARREGISRKAVM